MSHEMIRLPETLDRLASDNGEDQVRRVLVGWLRGRQASISSVTGGRSTQSGSSSPRISL